MPLGDAQLGRRQPPLERAGEPARIQPGDAITVIQILGGRMMGKPFYVDNLKLVEAVTP